MSKKAFIYYIYFAFTLKKAAVGGVVKRRLRIADQICKNLDIIFDNLDIIFKTKFFHRH